MKERIYFEINEKLAKSSKAMWSFSDYVLNSETESYKSEVNRMYDIADKIAINRPELEEDAYKIAERFSKKYAEWKNKGFSIDMMCPSVMICGAGNFPVRKKEKQISAYDRHMENYSYIISDFEKINNLLNSKSIIKSNDENAMEKLQSKLEELETFQFTMKNANAYYKKNNTLQDFNELNQESIDTLMDYMQRNRKSVPFESFELTNNNAKIKTLKIRIENLKKVKDSGTKETFENEFFKVVENAEEMRLQLIFNEKPSEEIRSMLKSNGFKWAPSQNAWQRQLTANAKYSLKIVIEKLKSIK